jgi:hypothetical protein
MYYSFKKNDKNEWEQKSLKFNHKNKLYNTK